MSDWIVESISDDGVVLIVFPDGERCTVTVPGELVAKFRRVVEMNRERSATREPRLAAGGDDGHRDGRVRRG